jgi:hypothetical protein
MRSRVCAISLVILVLLPVSSPFSTGELATFFGFVSPSTSTKPLKSRLPVPSLGQTATSHALPPSKVARSVKVVAAHRRSALLTVAVQPSSADIRVSPVVHASSPLVSPLRI